MKIRQNEYDKVICPETKVECIHNCDIRACVYTGHTEPALNYKTWETLNPDAEPIRKAAEALLSAHMRSKNITDIK